MFYCPNSANIFNITQTVTSTQEFKNQSRITIDQSGGGDKYEKIINAILKKKPLKYEDIKDISIPDLYKHSLYKQQRTSDKTLILNRIQD